MKKKLSKAARKKESTGINVEAAKKREARLEKRIERVEFKLDSLIYILAQANKKRGKGK